MNFNFSAIILILSFGLIEKSLGQIYNQNHVVPFSPFPQTFHQKKGTIYLDPNDDATQNLALIDVISPNGRFDVRWNKEDSSWIFPIPANYRSREGDIVLRLACIDAGVDPPRDISRVKATKRVEPKVFDLTDTSRRAVKGFQERRILNNESHLTSVSRKLKISDTLRSKVIKHMDSTKKEFISGYVLDLKMFFSATDRSDQAKEIMEQLKKCNLFSVNDNNPAEFLNELTKCLQTSNCKVLFKNSVKHKAYIVEARYPCIAEPIVRFGCSLSLNVEVEEPANKHYFESPCSDHIKIYSIPKPK